MNKIKLSDWAKQQNPPLSYKQAWSMYDSGLLPVKTETTAKNRVFVLQESSASKLDKFANNNITLATPTLAGGEMKASSVRRNAASTSTPTDQYANIREGISPYSAYSQRRGSGYNDGSMFPVSEAIHLCQLCYWNFAVFKNIVDFCTDFSCANIYLQGGNSKSRNFFNNLFDSLNISDLQEMFFRELYRSGNVFIYRFQVQPTTQDLSRLNKSYGIQASEESFLPSRYIIVNPYDIGVQSNIVFGSNVIFFKRLNGYEIHRLRAAETPEEKQFFDSLPKMTQDQINSGAGTVIIPLDPNRLFAIFNKKQSYEAMAIPMGFPVLKDIEWKAEMKRVDMAVARTMQMVVLQIKMGYLSKNDDYMFDPKAAAAMQSLFESESVGKVLVSDFTTELKWAIPTIGDFLDPNKYQIVNQDIKEGLNYILTGTDSKFANQFISVKLFVERLKQGRELFLKQFLIPEMKKIAKMMGFKSCPTPKFEDIDLRDEAEWERIVTQLTSLGILTPPEGLEAINTGRLPTQEESLEHQTEYRTLRDKGFYEPLVGGPYDNLKIAKLKTSQPGGGNFPVKPSGQNGRPNNVKAPQTTKKVGISRGSAENEVQTEQLYSLSKMKDNLIIASELKKIVTKSLCKSKNIKDSDLNDEQKNIIDEISDVIMANNEVSKWKDKDVINKYILNPINDNLDRVTEIDSIAAKHQISPKHAAYLIDCKK